MATNTVCAFRLKSTQSTPTLSGQNYSTALTSTSDCSKQCRVFPLSHRIGYLSLYCFNRCPLLHAAERPNKKQSGQEMTIFRPFSMSHKEKKSKRETCKITREKNHFSVLLVQRQATPRPTPICRILAHVSTKTEKMVDIGKPGFEAADIGGSF